MPEGRFSSKPETRQYWLKVQTQSQLGGMFEEGRVSSDVWLVIEF
jgi:hypothetical protein